MPELMQVFEMMLILDMVAGQQGSVCHVSYRTLTCFLHRPPKA